VGNVDGAVVNLEQEETQRATCGKFYIIISLARVFLFGSSTWGPAYFLPIASKFQVFSLVNSVLTSPSLMPYACYNPDKVTLGHKTVVLSCLMGWTSETDEQTVYPDKLGIYGLVPMRSWRMLLAFTTCFCLGQAQKLEFF